jgi:hypothetical protein
MAYLRCECNTGDIPHPAEAAHKRIHRRCTRAATVEVRRVRDTKGRACEASWYQFCEPCAKAIRAYQGSDVEVRDR